MVDTFTDEPLVEHGRSRSSASPPLCMTPPQICASATSKTQFPSTLPRLSHLSVYSHRKILFTHPDKTTASRSPSAKTFHPLQTSRRRVHSKTRQHPTSARHSFVVDSLLSSTSNSHSSFTRNIPLRNSPSRFPVLRPTVQASWPYQ